MSISEIDAGHNEFTTLYCQSSVPQVKERDMPKTTKQSEDVIQRAYLLKKLNRLKREIDLFQPPADAHEVVALLITWVKAQAKRAKRPGGIGRK